MMRLDINSLIDQVRTLAEFILDQREIPERILVALDRLNQKVPQIADLQEKAERYDDFKSRSVPDLDYMRKTASLLLSDAEYYRDRANGLREAHFFPAYSMDVISRSCQRQADHILHLVQKYEAEAKR